MSIVVTQRNRKQAAAIARGIKSRKLTLKEFAKLAGVARSTACAWRKGTHGMRQRHIGVVAELLHVDPSEFIA